MIQLLSKRFSTDVNRCVSIMVGNLKIMVEKDYINALQKEKTVFIDCSKEKMVFIDWTAKQDHTSNPFTRKSKYWLP